LQPERKGRRGAWRTHLPLFWVIYRKEEIVEGEKPAKKEKQHRPPDPLPL